MFRTLTKDIGSLNSGLINLIILKSDTARIVELFIPLKQQFKLNF